MKGEPLSLAAWHELRQTSEEIGQGQGKAFSGISARLRTKLEPNPGRVVWELRDLRGMSAQGTCCRLLKMDQEMIADSTAWHFGDARQTGDLRSARLSPLSFKIATSQNSSSMCIVFSEE
uniref:Uncharacterized protein n=1 Tax=Sphaerodactylus townsendi TaxID=933632 RepID=A0ACB8FKH6_9SAUR